MKHKLLTYNARSIMHKKINNIQAGFAPIALVMSIVVLGVVGFATWRVVNGNNKSSEVASTSQVSPTKDKAKSIAVDGSSENITKAIDQSAADELAADEVAATALEQQAQNDASQTGQIGDSINAASL
jgi:predicted negative regulator of RcsB-dependent stress response